MKKNFLYIVAALLICGGLLCGCGKTAQVESSSLPASSQVSSQEEETVQTYQLYNKLEYEFPSSWEQSIPSYELNNLIATDGFYRMTGNSSDGFKNAASISISFYQEDEPDYFQFHLDFSVEQFEYERYPDTTIGGKPAAHLVRKKTDGQIDHEYALDFGNGVYCSIFVSLQPAYDPTGEVAKEIEMILDKIKVIG
ncbi:hypothetical protein [Massilioclostridium coli]|uniref:hypothetical protein n=1 Tax=Massilioclostridium coli TaxID=1870991 RepID=UPI00085BE7B4|nr:hypothetical protein [Massilioclostridium coli]